MKRELKPGQLMPTEIALNAIGAIVDTLGRAEREMLAALLVRYYQTHGINEWAPVTRRELADWFPVDPQVQEWATRPGWRPDPPMAAVRLGLIEGWAHADDPGTPTELLIDCLSRPGAWRSIAALGGDRS